MACTLAAPAFADVDPIARAEIAHLKDLLNAADKRYEQRFNAQEGAVGSALIAQEKAIAAALSASKEAVTKAEVAAEKRLDAVNEFRGQLRDQATTFISQKDAEQRFIALSEKVALLQQRVDTSEGKSAGYSDGWGYVVGVIGVIAAIGGVYLSRNRLVRAT